MTIVPNELDELYVFAVQDPSDPVWETDARIGDMQQVDDPNDMIAPKQPTTIRTASGGLDFLNDLTEVVGGLFETETVATKPKRSPKLDTIGTRELGSDKWRAGRREIVASMSNPIVTESSKRRQVTLVNYGPNVAYLSSVGGAKAAAPNTIRLLVSGAAFYAPKTIPTRDNIWAVCATGETATVEIDEIFDMEP